MLVEPCHVSFEIAVAFVASLCENGSMSAFLQIETNVVRTGTLQYEC